MKLSTSLGVVAALLIIVTLVAGCSAGPASTKFKQTWTKSYSQTTCGDWDDLMEPHQRFVMAGDFLLNIHQGEKGSTDPAVVPIPPDNIINAFVAAMSNECSDHHSVSVTLASAAAYKDNLDLFKP